MAASRILPPRLRVVLRASMAILAIAVMATASIADDASDARPDLKKLRSKYVKVDDLYLSTVTAVYQRSDDETSPVRPRINLNLSNKSKREYWLVVQLTPPPPEQGRTGVVQLGPEERMEFESTQDSIAADTDYLLDFTVFADSAQTDTLEVDVARFRFKAKMVDALAERLAFRRDEREATTLPRTYENVAILEKFGFLATLTDRFWRVGTLVVKSDGLEHIQDKRTVSVAASQVRRVKLEEIQYNLYVVVYFDDGGKEKKVAFTRPDASRGELAVILSSIQAMAPND